MKDLKANFKYIIYLIIFTALLVLSIINFQAVRSFLATIVSVLTPFIAGFCIAFAVNELLKPLEKLWGKIFTKEAQGGIRKKGSRPLSQKLKRPICLILSLLIVLSAVFAIILVIIPRFAETVSSFAGTLPSYAAKTESWYNSVCEWFARHEITLPHLQIDLDQLADKLGRFLKQQSFDIINTTVAATTSILSFVVNIFLSIVFAIYLLAGKEKLCNQLDRVAHAYLKPDRYQRGKEIFQLTNRTFSNFVSGQVLEAIIIGTLCFIGMLIFRMPYAGPISVLVGFTALIPVFGAFIGTAIGALLILFLSPIKAFWFVIFIIVLQQFEGNVIYPRVVGKSVGLPGIWVLVAVTVGGGAFGFIGMLISVPVASLLYSLLRESVNRRNEQKASQTES